MLIYSAVLFYYCIHSRSAETEEYTAKRTFFAKDTHKNAARFCNSLSHESKPLCLFQLSCERQPLATNNWNFETLSETLVDVLHTVQNFLNEDQQNVKKEDASHMRNNGFLSTASWLIQH